MRTLRTYLLVSVIAFTSFSGPVAYSNPNNESHTGFVSRFISMMKEKFVMEDSAEVDTSRRNFLAGSGAVLATAGLGGASTVARLTGLSGISTEWLRKVARMRINGKGLDASGLESYVKALEQELASINDPAMRAALRARIHHAEKTIQGIGEIIDPVTNRVRDHMSQADTRVASNKPSPAQMRRIERKIEAARERLLRNSKQESTLIENIIEAEALLSPILRSRINMQVAYTRTWDEEFIVALDDEDVKLTEYYIETLWSIHDWIDKFNPVTTRTTTYYKNWLKARIEVAERALSSLKTSKRHFSCTEIVTEDTVDEDAEN